jgi:transcriptional regulator with XRE-family HTH domain
MTARNTGWKPWMAIGIAMREDGMTQAELAEKLGWSEALVSRTVNGQRRIYWDEVLAIAEVQDRPISWYLAGFSDDDNRVNPGYENWDPDQGVIPFTDLVPANFAPAA